MHTRAAVAALALLSAVPGDARGSCAARTPRQYFESAQLVFLGRAGKPRTEGTRVIQPFEVLLPLKGRPGPTFQWVHGVVRPPGGGASYRPGEVAVLFSYRGDLEPCAGNVPLSAQLPALPIYLELARKKQQPPSEAAFQLALASALKGYLHERARVPVVHEPLAGRKLRLEKTELPFVSRAEKGAVIITRALQSEGLIVVSGRYSVEGYVFSVLLWQSPKKLEVLTLVAAET